MKAISLHEPWASLIARGLKRYETRGWATAHRGPLVIHAARRPMDVAGERLLDELVEAGHMTAVERAAFQARSGELVAQVRLVRVLRITAALAEDMRGGMARPLARPQWLKAPSVDLERRVGNFTVGRCAWELADVEPLLCPVARRGRQGVFEVAVPWEERP